MLQQVVAAIAWIIMGYSQSLEFVDMWAYY